jgi:hypothetical protein
LFGSSKDSRSTSFPRRRESKFVAPPAANEVPTALAKLGSRLRGNDGSLPHSTATELFFAPFVSVTLTHELDLH